MNFTPSKLRIRKQGIHRRNRRFSLITKIYKLTVFWW